MFTNQYQTNTRDHQSMRGPCSMHNGNKSKLEKGQAYSCICCSLECFCERWEWISHTTGHQPMKLCNAQYQLAKKHTLDGKVWERSARLLTYDKEWGTHYYWATKQACKLESTHTMRENIGVIGNYGIANTWTGLGTVSFICQFSIVWRKKLLLFCHLMPNFVLEPIPTRNVTRASCHSISC